MIDDIETDLDNQLKADEAARHEPDVVDETPADEVTAQEPETEELEEEVKVEKTPDEQDYEKRIARLAYQEREARKAARLLQEENNRLKGQAPPLEKDAEIERQVQERAASLAKQAVFNEKANAVHRDGMAAFPDFAANLAGFHTAGLPISTELLETAMEVGKPHEIIHYLGKNLDEAERIMALQPHQMGVAIAKISAKLNAVAAPKAQSKAPAPIKPIAGKSKAEQTDENMPIAEYMKREDERYFSRR